MVISVLHFIWNDKLEPSHVHVHGYIRLILFPVKYV